MKKIIITLSIILGFSALASAQGYSIGDKAADFTLKNVDDKMVSLNDFKGEKGVVVIFTCNHCPFSIAYEDRIIALDKKYKKSGFPVLAINSNDPIAYPSDSFEAMKVRTEEKAFTFPYLFDEEQEVYPVFGAKKTPHIYLLQNRSGVFKVAYIGAIDNSARDESKVSETYLADAIDALLAGETPAVQKTKAVGCGIKAKK